MGITILSVDDHEVSRYLRTVILREAGYTVIEAGTGQERRIAWIVTGIHEVTRS